jgi:hypothetical protein
VAQSSVNVTEGSGKRLNTWDRTISSTLVQDQFVQFGEYPYPTYGVVAEAISVATTADHILQIMAGSSNHVRIRYIYVEQSAGAAAASNLSLQLLRLTTAGTGGSAITPFKFDTGDAAAGATAMTIPTAKGTESTLLRRVNISLRQNANTGTQEDGWEWRQAPNTKPLIIPAGTSNGIAIKVVAGVTTSPSVNIYVEFVETAFL